MENSPRSTIEKLNIYKTNNIINEVSSHQEFDGRDGKKIDGDFVLAV